MRWNENLLCLVSSFFGLQISLYWIYIFLINIYLMELVLIVSSIVSLFLFIYFILHCFKNSIRNNRKMKKKKNANEEDEQANSFFLWAIVVESEKKLGKKQRYDISFAVYFDSMFDASRSFKSFLFCFEIKRAKQNSCTDTHTHTLGTGRER